MVEQTDLVRLRMVRMSNVPDTLYMVNNAVPQCCHIINHQQIGGSQTTPPSVVAKEIPGGWSCKASFLPASQNENDQNVAVDFLSFCSSYPQRLSQFFLKRY